MTLYKSVANYFFKIIIAIKNYLNSNAKYVFQSFSVVIIIGSKIITLVYNKKLSEPLVYNFYELWSPKLKNQHE